MDGLFTFIKQNFFELLLCSAMLIAGSFRLLYPEIQEKEIQDFPLFGSAKYILIAFELLSIYFLFFATPYVKHIYLGIFAILCIGVILYYVSKRNIVADLKELSTFPNDSKSIFSHFLFVYIIIFLLFIKK
jgi:hypothetical protein